MFLYNKIQGDELKRYYFALLQCPRNKLILQQPLLDVHFYDGFLFCPIQSLLLRLNGVIMEIQPDHFQKKWMSLGHQHEQLETWSYNSQALMSRRASWIRS